MPWFGGSMPSEPLQEPRRTISGGPMRVAETEGSAERRVRLMAYAISYLKGHPVAEAIGEPLGDGLGMEHLVEAIAPIFARERSLLRWVALRGALTFLDVVAPSDATFLALMERMGIRHEYDEVTREQVAYVIDPEGSIPAEFKRGAVGLASAIGLRWQQYERISRMDTIEANADPLCLISDAVALDFIGWTAAAMLRSGPDVYDRLLSLPEPVALDASGWYVDPLFAKCQRYWDGSDWTARCRIRERRSYREYTMELR